MEKTHLYSKQSVHFNIAKIDRRINNGAGIAIIGMNAIQIAIATAKNNYAEDLNTDERITKFKELLKMQMSIEYF